MKPADDAHPSALARADDLYRAARFSDAARLLDEFIERGAPAQCGDAVILRARIALKCDAGAALALLTHHSGGLRSKFQQAAAEMLQGVAYARLGDGRSASAKLRSAAQIGRGDVILEGELAYHRAQVAWIARKLEVAERELERVRGSLEGDLLLEASVMRGAIFAARGNVARQGAILLDALRLVRERADPGVLPWAVIGSQIAYLARELPGTALRDAAYAEVARIPWTCDLGALHFTMVRAVAWRHALDGDYFNAFRRLKEAAGLAPSPGWSVTASCDRAYFAAVLGERRWSEQERSDAQELAAAVDWRSLDGEECFALLVLAELNAPRDPSLALSYVARYKDAGTRFAATLASRDDRRVGAQEAYAFGVVRHALGENEEAARLMREAYATYDAIGYDWRAGRAALALADVTHDGAWRARAKEKLTAYPRSWLAVREPGAPPAPALAEPDVVRLTSAQRGVYELLLRGLSTAQIAAEQGRSEFTVRNHVKVIFKVFGVNSRPALLARASGHART